MKETIIKLIEAAINTLTSDKVLPQNSDYSIQVTNTKNPEHGNFSSNIALMLAKKAGMPPQAVAEQLINAIPQDSNISKVEIAGPGFINFFVSDESFFEIIPAILAKKARFGEQTIGKGKRICLEFVSANPTGPLHVGHGRSAAFGATLAAILKATGFDVISEYYVNDAGRQMQILALSTWLRYIAFCDFKCHLPKNAYQGDYIITIAEKIFHQRKKQYAFSFDELTQNNNLPSSEQEPDLYIDALINALKEKIGEEGFAIFLNAALDDILEDIKTDLAEFGVHYDVWFKESALVTDGSVAKTIKVLTENKHLYEKAGATWFRATQFADEKDRVLVRANGQNTYFCHDIAYHLNKIDRNFDHLIDIFGADHHGYMARIQGSLPAMGVAKDKMKIQLVQFVSLFRGDEKVSMSTRSGSFVTLRELRDEVGNDAARFFYIMRKVDQAMDFDLALAKSQKNDNPVYYIQYAHARIASIFRQLVDAKLVEDTDQGLASLTRLNASEETAIIRHLAIYPETLTKAATHLEPHRIAQYLLKLADLLHSYYNAHRFLIDDAPLCQARLCLIRAVQTILHNGLTLLGVSAPDRM